MSGGGSDRPERLSDEQGLRGRPLGQGPHRRVVRLCPGEVTGRVEHLRQQVHVTHAAEEHPGPAERPRHRQVDVVLLFERLVPRRPGVRPAQPGTLRDRLDRLYRDPALAAGLVQRVEVLGVVGLCMVT